ncbi:BsuPI-related putative proteinase inhibitor [Microbacteriaceae bacterium 4G12]
MMKRVWAVFACLCIVVVGCGKEQKEPKRKTETVEASQKQREEKWPGLQLETEVKAYTDHLEVTLSLENTSDDKKTLTFPSSQQFEVVVTHPNEGEVCRYSKDRMFTQALTTVELKAGEKKMWKASCPYNSTPLRKGETYQITAMLLPREINDESVPSETFQKTIPFLFK